MENAYLNSTDVDDMQTRIQNTPNTPRGDSDRVIELENESAPFYDFGYRGTPFPLPAIIFLLSPRERSIEVARPHHAPMRVREFGK